MNQHNNKRSNDEKNQPNKIPRINDTQNESQEYITFNAIKCSIQSDRNRNSNSTIVRVDWFLRLENSDGYIHVPESKIHDLVSDDFYELMLNQAVDAFYRRRREGNHEETAIIVSDRETNIQGGEDMETHSEYFYLNLENPNDPIENVARINDVILDDNIEEKFEENAEQNPCEENSEEEEKENVEEKDEANADAKKPAAKK